MNFKEFLLSKKIILENSKDTLKESDLIVFLKFIQAYVQNAKTDYLSTKTLDDESKSVKNEVDIIEKVINPELLLKHHNQFVQDVLNSLRKYYDKSEDTLMLKSADSKMNSDIYARIKTVFSDNFTYKKDDKSNIQKSDSDGSSDDDDLDSEE
jgi:hypothetical protein